MGSSQTAQQVRQDLSYHERLRSYKIIRNTPDNKDLMEIVCPLYDTKVIPKWKEDIKTIEERDCLFLPQSFDQVEEGRCGSSGVIKVVFEYYPFTLQKEIANRVQLKSPFREEELWFLLYEITSSSIQFERLGKKSGDLRPKNIFINEEGLVKVVNQYSFPDEKINYMKALEDSEPVYLSPEQLSEFEKGIVNPRSDPVLAEAFSIGLSMLDAGLLTDNEELYDMKNLRFNLHKFHECIIRWKESSYSPFLIRTVENLLEINWCERPTPGEVRAVLEPYEERIRDLEIFTPNKEKSKAMLDSYQAGSSSKKKTPSQQDIRNNQPAPLAFNQVPTNIYPQQQISSPTFAPLSYETQRQPSHRTNHIESVQGVGEYNSRYVYPASDVFRRTVVHSEREPLKPMGTFKIVPNSRAYLQEGRHEAELIRY